MTCHRTATIDLGGGTELTLTAFECGNVILGMDTPHMSQNIHLTKAQIMALRTGIITTCAAIGAAKLADTEDALA